MARGTAFADVPRVATVYLSRSDPFGDGLPLYHVGKVVRETGRTVDDGTEDVYANIACAAGDSDLERLLRYMARADGELEGGAEGRAEMLLASIRNIMANLGLAAEAAMDALGVPQDERASYRDKLA